MSTQRSARFGISRPGPKENYFEQGPIWLETVSTISGKEKKIKFLSYI